tara:strand:+ start:10236 stop:10604 length:369 start_codon:yes stop_codon:yes gene_type:complete
VPIRSLVNATTQGPTGSSSLTQRSFRQLEQGGRSLGPTEARAAEQNRQVDGEFYGLVKDFLGDVNALQSRSGDALEAFVAGEITDLHQVMVASQEAGIAMDLLIEVRNRVVESFQEIMRIQV